ncbi:hypothetical protein GCM10022251_10220 [Phytohabitans flavus]|uniref:DUF3618 domain-containing protein n=1 Tax=Phytohabitans flavus TaxID=1076124 RepID=A0A6F8XK41_9ACTN|nr:DUF3618 domain-containing protein [Phytohabitans flavus]BCB74180.1 hypothetical protein Pflav_005900 [Phytohabitans flavus]
MVSTNGRVSANGKVDTEALRAEIRQTRAELGETVQALAAKADVKARVRRSAAHTAERARENRVQLAAAATAVTGVLAAIVVLMVLRKRSR